MKDRSGALDAPHQPDVDVTGPEERPGGVVVAWAGFVFGSVVSIAANILAARIPPAGAPGGWRPSLVAQLGAAVWPVALLLSVEILARVRWPSSWGWRLARFGGVVAVAAGSAVISYGHIHSTLLLWGYSNLAASVGPLVVDGLMVASGFGLLAHRHQARVPVEDATEAEVAEVLAEASRTVGVPVGLAHSRTYVYQLFDESGDLLYVGITADLTTRLATHRRKKEWFSEVDETVATMHESRLEALATERDLIERMAPKYNLAAGSFRDAACGSGPLSPVPPATDLDRARQLVKLADENGQQVGRPTLMKVLGITDHQAKQLLKQIRDERGEAVEEETEALPELEPVGSEA